MLAALGDLMEPAKSKSLITVLLLVVLVSTKSQYHSTRRQSILVLPFIPNELNNMLDSQIADCTKVDAMDGTSEFVIKHGDVLSITLAYSFMQFDRYRSP